MLIAHRNENSKAPDGPLARKTSKSPDNLEIPALEPSPDSGGAGQAEIALCKALAVPARAV